MVSHQFAHRKGLPHPSLLSAGSLAKKSADIPRKLLGIYLATAKRSAL